MNDYQTGPIVLLTDFGTRESFSGILKGVIHSIHPKADVIDLTHGIRPMDIAHASFTLLTAYRYFPFHSIFCVVVDPGVGSERKAVCIQTSNYFFVGPDNGVLWEAAARDGICRIICMSNPRFFLDSISSTFHGRDIFAPVSAHLSKGTETLSDFGSPMDTCVRYEIPPVNYFDGYFELSILHIDLFGNIILNITHDAFRRQIAEKRFCLEYGGKKIDRVATSYAAGQKGEPFFIYASSGFMEISVKNESAAHILSVNSQDKFIVRV